jgi:SAM-dependent methyltransferase
VTLHDELVRMYDESDDPWSFETSWYERRKYAITLASLPRERYRSAYEPGCSIGVLTRLLADRCDALLGSDFVPRAVEAARQRLAAFPHVRIEHLATPVEWPDCPFDLIVLSELTYFLRRNELLELARCVRTSLEDGGTLVAVNWRGAIEPWAVPIEETHAILREIGGLSSVAQHLEPAFLLEVFER